jgi:hypothetical protein
MYFPVISSLIHIYTHIKKFYPGLLEISAKKKNMRSKKKAVVMTMVKNCATHPCGGTGDEGRFRG